jgi:hypothetical protein
LICDKKRATAFSSFPENGVAQVHKDRVRQKEGERDPMLLYLANELRQKEGGVAVCCMLD